jgi:hypothetical protein
MCATYPPISYFFIWSHWQYFQKYYVLYIFSPCSYFILLKPEYFYLSQTPPIKSPITVRDNIKQKVKLLICALSSQDLKAGDGKLTGVNKMLVSIRLIYDAFKFYVNVGLIRYSLSKISEICYSFEGYCHVLWAWLTITKFGVDDWIYRSLFHNQS